MRSGEEIQEALRVFAKGWSDYSGSERGEAQTFLNELIACYGANRRAVSARFEDAHTADGIMDLYWPDVCIIEMKAPHYAERLSEYRKQALDYWHSSDDVTQNRAAPPYVVLCAFQRAKIGHRLPRNIADHHGQSASPATGSVQVRYLSQTTWRRFGCQRTSSTAEYSNRGTRTGTG
jgi:hypothetical protein